MWNDTLVRFPFFFFLLALGAAPATAQTPPPVVPLDAPPAELISPAPHVPPPGFSARDAIILGVVEGLTEFLPVSSTGHLIITNRALGLDDETPLRDKRGAIIWHTPPSPANPTGIPVTLKLAADTYIVVIQVGAIFAVVLLLHAQLIGIARGLLGQNAAGVRLLRNLLLAFFPVVILGLSVDDWIDANLFSVGTVIVALVSGAVLMLAAERWRRALTSLVPSRKEPADLSIGEALGVGFMQCLALWPGMSRSMVTMVGGYFVGLAPAKAAEFSFLLGLPVLGSAAGYKLWQAGPAMIAVFEWGEMLLGGIVACVSAAIAVKFFVAYLGRHGLEIFAIYRLVLAAVLAFVFLA